MNGASLKLNTKNEEFARKCIGVSINESSDEQKISQKVQVAKLG